MLIVVHITKNPHLLGSLRRQLVQVGTGLLVGRVSRRVGDAILETVRTAVLVRGGTATVLHTDNTPQGYVIRAFNTAPVTELDGLYLGILSKNTAKDVTKP